MALDRGDTVSNIESYTKHIYFDRTISEKCFYKKEIDITNITVCIYYAEELYIEKPFDVVDNYLLASAASHINRSLTIRDHRNG